MILDYEYPVIKNKNFSEIIEGKQQYEEIFSSRSSDIESNIICIDENLILASSLNIEEKISLINELRAASLADTKNKISTNTDEYLYSYIENKKK